MSTVFDPGDIPAHDPGRPSFDIGSTSTPIFKAQPIDEAITKQERFLLRRLRHIRRAAVTATQPAIVTIHIGNDGRMEWFVAGKGEGSG